ncbi:hypothetical protein H4R18_003679 [Coemansia javaensis]|uniref:RING-type domain-containing protein n=1 Tax=Coemansia javaensis TaxID=2761396 RepID=A0A9W8HD04_9FUNG|nr:hypothetical protein H4R18_003679 [Coemansia javaensis]
MEHVEFFRSFPLLVPESLEPLKADGYMEGVRVHVAVDAGPTGGTYCIDAVKSTPEIEQFLNSKREELDGRLRQCTSALSFARELEYILAAAPVDAPERTSRFYSRIIDECDGSVGWDCIVSFDEKSQLAEAQLEDESGRRHSVYINFATETFSSDVEEGSVPMEGTRLAQYMAAVGERCRELRGCWELLDEVDATLCVLQPAQPRRRDLWRRVAVTDLATALVETAPGRRWPRIVVYGPASVAGPLNARARAARAQWSARRPARDNIEAVLGCALPEPSADRQRDTRLECGICFAFMAGAEPADQLCGSDACAQPFHRSCLLQWLATKEDTRQSFATLFGKCPYCGGHVSVTRV